MEAGNICCFRPPRVKGCLKGLGTGFELRPSDSLSTATPASMAIATFYLNSEGNNLFLMTLKHASKNSLLNWIDDLNTSKQNNFLQLNITEKNESFIYPFSIEYNYKEKQMQYFLRKNYYNETDLGNFLLQNGYIVSLILDLPLQYIWNKRKEIFQGIRRHKKVLNDSFKEIFTRLEVKTCTSYS